MNLIVNKQVSVGIRIVSMLLDHVFMSMICVVFFIPGIIFEMAKTFNENNELTYPHFLGGPLIYVGILGFSFYLCKDIFGGQSIAKRIFKLQLVHNTTGQVASPLRCFIRNLFIVFWPIEAIIALINPSRRLGDFVAGTKLIVFDPSSPKPNFKIGQVIISILLAYGLNLMFLLAFNALISSFFLPRINYDKTSLNFQKSRELEQLFTDSLGQYLTPSVEIYDKILDEDLKYISTELILKENYLEDDSNYMVINTMASRLIYSKYSKDSITGVQSYVYLKSGRYKSRSIRLGVELKSKRNKE